MNLQGVNKGTWIRTITLLVVLINQVALTIFDEKLLPFGDQEVYEIVSTVATFVMSIIAGWKNNGFTGAAQKFDYQLKQEKRNK